MKFSEMNELDIKDWNGLPFEAYRTTNVDLPCDGLKTEMVGYVNGKWVSKNGIKWLYVYPVAFNKPKRMTNRQLAMWLAKGNGQWRYMDTDVILVETKFNYGARCDNVELKGNIRVRKWDSEEWIEPTIDLLED